MDKKTYKVEKSYYVWESDLEEKQPRRDRSFSRDRRDESRGRSRDRQRTIYPQITKETYEEDEWGYKTSYSDFEKEKKTTSERSNSGSRPPLKCVVCKAEHRVDQCQEFKKLKIPDRYRVILDSKACLSCLWVGHQTKTCKYKNNMCGISGCKYKHHRLLHEDNPSKTHIMCMRQQEEGIEI